MPLKYGIDNPFKSKNCLPDVRQAKMAVRKCPNDDGHIADYLV
jgi:hypothetical protein